nr:MAG TPA: hypothetical protein [Caudoviricetes sp.]
MVSSKAVLLCYCQKHLHIFRFNSEFNYTISVLDKQSKKSD